MPVDAAAADVGAALVAASVAQGSDPATFFGGIIRQALDEVIDGPRTQRWSLDQLTSTEKTYIGTKIEILVRSELELANGPTCDVEIAGHDVDIKWSKSLSWMIGPENVGKVCLGLGLRSGERYFAVGVFRATRELLRGGRNRDGKVSPTAEMMKNNVLWLVKDADLPQDFIAALDPEVREAILSQPSAQARVRRLVSLLPETPIPRHAFLTVAGTKGDPIRRLRKDAHVDSPLGGMIVLHTGMRRKLLNKLGFSDLPDDHWLAVPEHKVRLLTADE